MFLYRTSSNGQNRYLHILLCNMSRYCYWSITYDLDDLHSGLANIRTFILMIEVVIENEESILPNDVVNQISNCRNIVVYTGNGLLLIVICQDIAHTNYIKTGAGISQSTGIPTYRGKRRKLNYDAGSLLVINKLHKLIYNIIIQLAKNYIVFLTDRTSEDSVLQRYC